jgi:hypothetical protein
VHVDDDESDEDFRDFIAELFITNSISGPVTQKIYNKVARAKAEGVSDLARVGNSGKAWKKYPQRSDEKADEGLYIS